MYLVLSLLLITSANDKYLCITGGMGKARPGALARAGKEGRIDAGRGSRTRQFFSPLSFFSFYFWKRELAYFAKSVFLGNFEKALCVKGLRVFTGVYGFMMCMILYLRPCVHEFSVVVIPPVVNPRNLRTCLA